MKLCIIFFVCYFLYFGFAHPSVHHQNREDNTIEKLTFLMSHITINNVDEIAKLLSKLSLAQKMKHHTLLNKLMPELEKLYSENPQYHYDPMNIDKEEYHYDPMDLHW